MKIIDRKEIDAKLMTGIHILQRQFGCRIKTVYAYKVEHQDSYIGALVGYFNRRINEIYINISKQVEGTIIDVGTVLVSEGKYGIQADILEGAKEELDAYRDIIDELSLEIYRKEQEED
ncbi:hypothetical protein [Romboutsia ilealis]|uniref:hypothetical protein n=1 Tax=Romboutsia ilealis TaxID=1115758 RepID=UPI0027322775|nr:hypothetical protein [Romboutsia ilealis]